MAGALALRLTGHLRRKQVGDETTKQKPIKVLMVCAMGMSSSLLENKTKEAAAKAGVPFELKAVSTQEIARWDPTLHWYDVVLVAPQVFYKRKSIEQIAKPHGIIVQDIDTVTFGMVDGEKLFQQIMEAIRARDEGQSES
ncbi:MAG TPA: PTS sugar transporter subunit IIB [Chloroflexi bacterium]|nr:PTS sugar transporter subunit IIB [Chloroflexota bacterium]